MKIQIVDQTPSYLKILLEVNKEDIAPSYKAQIAKFAKTAQIKGFRVGKAPESLIRKMAGKDIFIESFSKSVEEHIDKYIAEQEIALILPALLKPVDINQEMPNSFDNFENASYTIELLPINKFDKLDWQNCQLDFTDTFATDQDLEILKTSLEEKETDKSEVEQDHKGENGLVAIEIVHPVSGDIATFSMPYKQLSPEFDAFLNDYKSGDSISFKVGNMLADHTKIKHSTNDYVPEMDEIQDLKIAGFFNKQATQLSLKDVYNEICSIIDLKKTIEEPDEQELQHEIKSFIEMLKFTVAHNAISEDKVISIGDSLGIRIDQDVLKKTLQSQFTDSNMDEEQWSKVLNYWTCLYIYHIVGDAKKLEKQANANANGNINYTSNLVLSYTTERYLGFSITPKDSVSVFTDLLKGFALFQVLINMSYRELSGDRKKASQILATQDTKISFWETVLEKAQINTLIS